MQQWTVKDVMTSDVLSVNYDTPPAAIVTTMRKHDVSAVAVVDEYDSVLGVVTRTDVLKALELRTPRRRRRAPWRRRAAAPGWAAASAGQMMSAPAMTVKPDATLAQAGRLMAEREVNRLLVIGADRRLLGIVTAADLLKVYARSDEVIRADARRALATLPAVDVALDVHDGVATLAGTVADGAVATLVQQVVRDVPGVTAVWSEVAVDAPGTAARPVERPQHDSMDGWWTNRDTTE